MRVQQDCEHGENSANSNQMLLNQLREITGIKDLQILQSALNESQGDISHAVGLLTTQTSEEEPVHEEASAAEPHRDTTTISNQDKNELQAAIELSLQESQQVKAEQRELHRVLEVSAEENAMKMKRKKNEASGESCNPADWIRQEVWPVGIRNVGNTCWFSAVIQSLFHLPVFRRLVLNYCLSEHVLEKCKSHSEKRNIAFMQELRCLFALMVGSQRRFVDPSAVLELLRDAFRTSEAQQDVSEFTHKLLDWLEDAFQLVANESNPEDKQDNPMVQLFYGTFVAERAHEGKTLSTIEQFGQYPLQVNGFNNLDECLEGAMVAAEIETGCDQAVSSGQERWFSKLPPVLTFELSRFEFNQSLGRPEKIHKKLEFSQIIYMDRYLHKNFNQSHGRRSEAKRLKDQLTVLQQKLDSYKNYGSGPNKYPLADMLQYVLEFATTTPASTSSTSTITPAHIECISENTSFTEANDAGSSDSSDCPSSATQRTPIHKQTQCKPLTDKPLHPAPSSISYEELHFVRSCLQRWRSEVENNINELKAEIDKISQALEGMYSDNSLCQVPYRLHAVLVHEGQASAGHYWAYIYDHTNKRWLKYNDVMVTESSWEELMRESYGGMTNASAYCLMYINDRMPHLIAEDTDNETGQVLQGLYSLPPIMRRYVREDNHWFQQQLREWEEQFHQAPQDEPQVLTSPAPTSSEEIITETQHPDPNPMPEQEHDGACTEPNMEDAQKLDKYSEVAEISLEALDSSPQHTEEVKEVIEDTAGDSLTASQLDDSQFNPQQFAAATSSDKKIVETPQSPTSESHEDQETDETQSDNQIISENTESEAAPNSQPELEEAETQAVSAEEDQAEARPENEMAEVEIPNVGKILVLSDSDGYNEEMMLTPAMQGVILAIAKARDVFDKDGPEAGLIKAFHEEYSRLYELAQEQITPQQDPRLQHILVYFFQNKAPDRVIERSLLEQFGDRNLSFDDRSISIMREARTKLRLIKPEDMDMEEYMQWHDDYSMFKTVFAYLLTGLEQYQNGKIREALIYLAHAYQDNSALLKNGEKRGVDLELIALYRRKCLKELNENAATLFTSGEESQVEEGVTILNDCVIPCMHLIVRESVTQEDMDAIEIIRSHWCSYLGQDMDELQQEKLSEFLPRVLDCSAERVVLKEPPKVRKSPHDLCSRLAAVMESVVTVK